MVIWLLGVYKIKLLHIGMHIDLKTEIVRAYRKARKSRRKKQEVYLFDLNLEENLLKMVDEISSRKYVHQKYKKIILYDSKKRLIHSPVFRDHILHHFVYAQIYDVLDKKMVHSSFACRKWYGLHKAVLYLAKIIRQWRVDKLYYLKLDFSKYFWTINHELLKKKLRKYIQDELILYCLDVIIWSYQSSSEYDELLKNYSYYIQEKNKWIPIWWIISQLLANFYLNDFDQYLRNKKKLKFVRYMDDVVILWTKAQLLDLKHDLIKFAEKEKLILNPKKFVLNTVEHWLKFVWYKFKNNKIWAWKRLRHSLWLFVDRLKRLNPDLLTEDDKFRLRSMLESRLGFFMITSNWESYIQKVKHQVPSWW